MDLRCSVGGCGRVASDRGYCKIHHDAVVLRGDDPGRLRQVSVMNGEVQCPAVGQWDGANCCALVDGHDGPHENTFGWGGGSHVWGTAEEWREITKSHYRMPKIAERE